MQPREGDGSSRNFSAPIKTLICLGLILIGGATGSSAQIFKTIYAFGSSDPDGADPYQTGVVLAGNTVYGTTYDGGIYYGGGNGDGVVFSVNADGTGFTVLHAFSPASSPYTNADGVAPQGSLTLVGDTLYGAAVSGGLVFPGDGTIYSVKTNGDAFTLIHSFDSTNGSRPNGPLVVTGGRIYGTTEFEGNSGYGTVFSLSVDGSDFKILHAFAFEDGMYPNGVVFSGDTLYGNTYYGGTNGNGVVFSIKTNGNDFAVLHTFAAGTSSNYTKFNEDGINPQMLPAVAGDTIYGTAIKGGHYGNGTVYSLKTNGSNFNILRAFADVALEYDQTIIDGGGSVPMGITASNGVLYGVTAKGGTYGSGVVYSINADGSHFSVLHTFTAANFSNSYTNHDGQSPAGELVLCGNTLYGTAYGAGQYGRGTVFSVVVQPAIANLQLAGSNLVINGFNGVAGENCVTLFSPDMTLPLSNWTAIATNVLPAGNFTISVTNAVAPSASNGFYILEPR